MHAEGADSMASESVQFGLADGTTVAVESRDYRRVYDELWILSRKMPGAVSTAGLLLNAARHPSYPRDVDLNGVQSAALRRAINRSEEASA
jgi:hypothetical protein